MNGYYAYYTGDDGHVTSPRYDSPPTTKNAKQRAKQLVDGHSVELWQEDCKIATFDPEHGTMPS